MQTTIHERSPVEYIFEIEAEAEELAPRIDEALKAQRAQTDMKGFRQGKVPLSMVKKMFGKRIGFEVAEKFVQEAFQKEIMQNDDYELMGQAQLVDIDFEVDGPLHAEISFGVRPEVTLEDLEGEQVDKLVYDISDEDIEQEVTQLRTRHAELAPFQDDEVISEEDYVQVDLQRIDENSGTPIVGDKEEDVSFFLDDERLRDELRTELLGRKSGDTFRAELPHMHGDHDHGPGHDHGDGHTHLYEVTIKEAKHRELPELDDAFIGEATEHQVSSEDELRDLIRKELDRQWRERAQNFTRGRIMKRMLDLHPVAVPEAAVESFLDAFVNDVRRRNEDELPDDFDEQAFRATNREEAEQQARWMLIRDQFVENEGLTLSDEDMDAFYEQRAEEMEEEVTAEQLRNIYQQMGNLKGQIEQQILSDKVFSRLEERLDMVEKDVETLEKEQQPESEQPSALVT